MVTYILLVGRTRFVSIICHRIKKKEKEFYWCHLIILVFIMIFIKG